MAMTDRDAATLARMVDEAAKAGELDADQHAQLREHVAVNAKDMAGSDGWYWRGPDVADLWLEDCSEDLASGEQMPSWLDYEERRADRMLG